MLVILSTLILTTSFVTAEDFAYNNPTLPKLNPTPTTTTSFNNNTANVNNSQYLQGYTPFNLCNANNSYCSTFNSTYAAKGIGNISGNGTAQQFAFFVNNQNITSQNNFYRNGQNNIQINESGTNVAALTVSGAGDGGFATNFIFRVATAAGKTLFAASDSNSGASSYGTAYWFGSSLIGGDDRYLMEFGAIDISSGGDQRRGIIQTLYKNSLALTQMRFITGQPGPASGYADSLTLQSDDKNCVNGISNCNATWTVQGDLRTTERGIIGSLSSLESLSSYSTLEVLGIVSGGMCSGTPLACSTGNYPTISQCEAVACVAASGGTCSTWDGTDQTTCESGHEGCSWQAPQSCDIYNGDQISCEGQGGCTWDGGSETCSGEFGGNLCNGNYYDSCTGTPNACSTYGDEGTCTTYPDCLWGGETQKAQYNEGDNNFTDGDTGIPDGVLYVGSTEPASVGGVSAVGGFSGNGDVKLVVTTKNAGYSSFSLEAEGYTGNPYFEAQLRASNLPATTVFGYNYANMVGGSSINIIGHNGLGQTSLTGGVPPTFSGWLTLRAGTTTNASMVIPTGSLLTTPISGAVEYNGANFFGTNSSGTRMQLNNVNVQVQQGNFTVQAGNSTTYVRVGGSLFDHVTEVNNSGTVETQLFANSLGGRTFERNGDKVIASYTINSLGSATATSQYKIIINGTNVYDSGALGFSVATVTNLKIEAMRVGINNTRVTVTAFTTTASAIPYASFTSLANMNFTNPIVINVTGTRAGVGAASNDISGKMGYGEYKPSAT